MKKLLTLAALLGTASLSFAQGFVAFGNTLATRTSNNGVLQTTSPVGSYYYALLVAPSTQDSISPDFAGWTYVGPGTNTALAGRMSGNSSSDSAAVQVAGYGPTATADFAIVGWSANIGRDWATVAAGFHGFGAAGTWTIVDPNAPGGSAYAWFGIGAVAQNIPLAPAGGPYNNVWGPAAVPGLNLQQVPIPEPSTFALAGLGAAALVIFRRRKQ